MPIARPFLPPALTHRQSAIAPSLMRAVYKVRPTKDRAFVVRNCSHLVAPVSAALPAGLQAVDAATPTLWRAAGTQLAGVFGKNTLVGSHPFLSASGGLLGLVATGALAQGAYQKLPPQQQADVRSAMRVLARFIQTGGPYATSLLLGIIAGAVGQEGFIRWYEARHASAALMLATALPLGLASLETIGKKRNIPFLRAAWSGPAKFCEQHQRDLAGMLMSATGGASAAFALRLLAAPNPWGWMLLAGSVPASLGGLELIGREHNIKGLRNCLSRPIYWSIAQVRQVVSLDAALQATGSTLAMAGIWGVLAGVRHLGVTTSDLGDALGAAQVTAGTVAAGMGIGMLAERRKWVPSAQHVFERCNDAMASGIFLAWGAALGKFAAANIATFGPGYINTTAAAVALGMVNSGVVAAYRQTQKKLAIDENIQSAVEPHVEARIGDALDRAWALSGSVASGVWAALVAGGLLHGNSTSAWLYALNAVPQLGAAAVFGAISAGMMGYALNDARMKKTSNEIADRVKQFANHALHVAQRHPAPTLATLAMLLVLARRAL